jgi:CDP-diacylglycerol--serine O-phosphatidyltransferase
MSPAFLIACFAALRLAKFNITATQQSNSFIGMPVPAVGLFVAAFPLINWFNPFGIAQYFYNYWVLYGIIALLCWLMVSKVRFFKLMPVKWPQIALGVIAVAGLSLLKLAAVPVIFLSYIVLSFVYKPKEV